MNFTYTILIGLLIGSFLNVCIYRLPKGESVVFPSSYCYSCKSNLKLFDLIPVASWLMLFGKCRYCNTQISIRYPLVELLTGILFSVCFLKLDITLELTKALILTSFLIVITFIDYDHQLILDKVVIWLAGAGVVINLILNNINQILSSFDIQTSFIVSYTSIPDMLLGALLGGGLLLLIAVASRGGMGGGDIKFAAALGLWLGWKFTLMTLLISFILGGVFGVIILALKLKGRKDYIPFGPFIAAGAFISYLYGIDILKLYIRWIM
ncbi:prepilin peptidase [Dendrosporobacter sp. 1207_IL3150]|uniref:prepilin peptidase n=1 Tax=Dendrosporobacter sp. 1207_IL3150 TaxID=3084054 RepID=UPI002FD982A5